MTRLDQPSVASRPRVVVAGVGLLTTLGASAWQTFQALLAGRSMADRTANLSEHTDPVRLVQALGSVSVATHAASDPTIELCERAAREAVTEAGVDLNGLPTFLGSSKGAVTALAAAAGCPPQPTGEGVTPRDPQLATRPADAHLALALGPHGYLSHHLQARTGLWPQTHVVAACASSLAALHRARQAMIRPDAHVGPHALVLSAESALVPYFVHSYRRLGVLAPLSPEGYRGRPLDADRGGFMLAAMAAAVLLRRLPPGTSPRPGQIELIGTAEACETHDLIRPDPEMPALRRIARNLFAGQRIDALHPHAPGTADHDPTELHALHDALDPEQGPTPVVYASKGAIGHGLGSAGLVAFVLACLSARCRRLPPMPWLTQPLRSPFSLTPQAQALPENPCQAVFAAGFGGHVAAAAIR